MSANLLIRRRRQATALLWAERLVPALTPGAMLLLAFCATAALGWNAALPPGLSALLLAALVTATACLAWLRLRPLRRPTASEVDRRLERNAGDPHRPLATLADQPAWAGADAVWQAHRDRALARTAALRAGWPHLPAPIAGALGGGLLILACCLIAAGPAGPARLWHAFTPDVKLPTGPATQLQAWIVPPPRTGLGPIFLRQGDPAPISVPLGAKLTVSLTGGHSRPSLLFAGTRHAFQTLGPDSFQADLIFTASGALDIRRHGHSIAHWNITAAADQPPSIAYTGPPALAELREKFPWSAKDDYGLASITAELHLRERPGAAPLEVKIPMDGTPRAATGTMLPDLTASPWAGLPVLAHYIATDSSGQRGTTDDVELTLPERVFINPLARALVGVRRMLVADPKDTIAATSELDRLSGTAATQLPPNQWLNLRATAALLFEQPDDLDQAQNRLWLLATQIEDGGVTDAKQQLTDARNALQDALAAPVSPDQQRQVAALTQRLQQAMLRYLQAMQRQAARNGAAPPEQQGGRSIDASQLLQMEQQMEAAAKAGRLDEAMDRLRQLSSILDSLRQSNRTASSGQKQDDRFQKMLQAQSALQSHTEQRLSQDGDPRASNTPERDPDEAASAPDPATQRSADAAAQGALRKSLGDLAQRLGETTGQVPDGLARADTAMRDAARALGQNDDPAARAAQQRALDGLRQGGEQLAQQQGDGPGDGEGNQPAPGTDPLGRPTADSGDASDGNRLPVNGDAARSRALRDELRRRAADRTRPQGELNYIDRLLRPY